MSDDVKTGFRLNAEDRYFPSRHLGQVSSLISKLTGVEAIVEAADTVKAQLQIDEAISDVQQHNSETRWGYNLNGETNEVMDTFKSATRMLAYSPAYLISTSLEAAKEALFGEPDLKEAKKAINAAKEQAVELKDALEADLKDTPEIEPEANNADKVDANPLGNEK